ncbi:unnamed protein product [Prorocentrum cordatum]|uniref:Uncharacterized protein n=1 Tax=Prorocentrum cordatum TaxID=2364126 RepID=A0ABN9PX42_9DINO|nr:unnamed protein product [Polarella glacialis]
MGGGVGLGVRRARGEVRSLPPASLRFGRVDYNVPRAQAPRLGSGGHRRGRSAELVKGADSFPPVGELDASAFDFPRGPPNGSELRAAVALRFARRLQAAQVPLFISGIGTNNLAAEIHHTAPTCGPSSAPSGRCSWSRTRRCFRACGGAAGSWAPARAGCSQRQRAPPAWAGHGHAALLFP